MCTKNQLLEIIKEVVGAYNETYGTAVRSIILYGSYARGDFSDQSDVDFAAIVSGNRLDLQEKLYQVWDRTTAIGIEYDAVISPIVIPADEFNKYRDILPYYRNIAIEGQKVG